MKHSRSSHFVLAGLIGFSFIGSAEACDLTAGPGLLPQGTSYLQKSDRSVILYRAEVRRDDDGAPNAYSPCGANYGDPACGGIVGLDHICSGVTVKNAAQKIVPRSEPNVGKPGTNSMRCLAAFREAQAAEFPKCGTGRACVTEWPAMLLDKRKPEAPTPVIEDKPPYKGYYVSTTTLHRPDGHKTGDVSSLDARKVPFIVVPGSSVLTGTSAGHWGFGSTERADLSLVLRRQPDGSTRGVFAVVGDTGPRTEIGEGSPALLMRLRGVTGVALDAERPLVDAIGPGPNAPTYVLFRNSTHFLSGIWPERDLTAADIASAGAEALKAAGGLPAIAGCPGVPSNVGNIVLVTE